MMHMIADESKWMTPGDFFPNVITLVQEQKKSGNIYDVTRFKTNK